MTTKEKIIKESLKLFSVKGYKGTSVKNIAEAVGIKDSSLYKHFKSKEEIFNTIILEMQKRMENMSERMGLPESDDFSKAAKIYSCLSVEQLIELSRNIFLFYLKDEFVSKIWRIANIEQYQNPKIYQIFRKIFMEESIKYQTAIFTEMVKTETFIEVEPQIMAMNFYAPIFFLISKYSGRQEGEEEAVKILENQVKEFYRIYHK